MARLVEARREPSFDGPTPAARRGGRYQAYHPDTLSDRPLMISAELSQRAHEVELETSPCSRSLEGLARFLLRSEAMACSRIEGLQVSAKQVALAELARTDGSVTRGFTKNAALVANNIATPKQATTELADAPAMAVPGIDALHKALLPDERHHGLREIQNWIGGNSWNPVDAEFVPPPPEQVRPLAEDFCAYLGGGAHAPLVQAALAHAQFETIHPYTDGNGRVGRDGVSAWLSTFLEAASAATAQAEKFGQAIEELTSRWRTRLAEYRTGIGVRDQPRAGSAQSKLLLTLPEIPVLTARTTQATLDVSFPVARAALDEFAEAGILSRKSVDRGTTAYLADEVFDLLTFAEPPVS